MVGIFDGCWNLFFSLVFLRRDGRLGCLGEGGGCIDYRFDVGV